MSTAVPVAAILALAAFTFAPSPAHAGQTCAGQLVFAKPLMFKKKNCALAMHAGSTWGKKLRTTIWLYQAGPVRMKAAHRCVFASAEIEVKHSDGSPARLMGRAVT